MKMTSKLEKRPSWQQSKPKIQNYTNSLDRILIASDFDGTLSPLVNHPGDAMLDPNARDILSELINLPQVTVAFLSGRSLLDLKSRIDLDDSRLIFAGNHGFELCGLGPNWLHPVAVSARPHLDSLIARFSTSLAPFEGTEIEDKGASISLHYRRLITKQQPELKKLVHALLLPKELKLHAGNHVFEFRPDVDWNKGKALRRIMLELDFSDHQTLYMGDDVTDEDIFEELDHRAITVHVGSAGKPSSAMMNAEDPEDAAAFLSYLLTQRISRNSEAK